MSLTKTWYTIDEVMDKFGLERRMITEWIDNGIVRTERTDNGIEMINIDDIELKVQELTGI